VKKKLVMVCPIQLNRDSARQTGRSSCSKKVEKSEKKACQPFKNSIILPKPNQTNGETNDKKRTK
jgi:hypothetical protein